jgi:hypothetical protein
VLPDPPSWRQVIEILLKPRGMSRTNAIHISGNRASININQFELPDILGNQACRQ